jgi:hypothetical protein
MRGGEESGFVKEKRPDFSGLPVFESRCDDTPATVRLRLADEHVAHGSVHAPVSGNLIMDTVQTTPREGYDVIDFPAVCRTLSIIGVVHRHSESIPSELGGA